MKTPVDHAGRIVQMCTVRGIHSLQDVWRVLTLWVGFQNKLARKHELSGKAGSVRRRRSVASAVLPALQVPTAALLHTSTPIALLSVHCQCASGH